MSTDLQPQISVTSPSRVESGESARRGDRLNPSKSQRTYWVLIAIRNALRDIIQQHVQGNGVAVVVDYGCGNMPYRTLFEPYVEEYIGGDFDGNDLADCTLTDFATLPRLDSSVDLVLSTQVLEHVSDPAAYLGEAWRILRPGGRLILSTHGVWKYHPDPLDFWRWTSAGLKKQIAEASFVITHFQGVMGPVATALQLWQDAVRSKFPVWLRPVFFRVMQQFIRRADLRCPAQVRNRDACVYILVAEKQMQQ